MYLLLLVGFIYILFRFRMHRTIFFIGLIIYSELVLVLSIIVGGGLTWFATGGQFMRNKDIIKPITSRIVDSPNFSLWDFFIIPFVAIFVDPLFIGLHMAFTNGSTIMWMVIAVGLVTIWRGWHSACDAFIEARDAGKLE